MEPLTTDAAIAYLRTCTGDPTKFKIRPRGYVDWKFGELCEYRGFADAVQYVEAMRRWHDFQTKYTDCLLNTTFEAFCRAEKDNL